MLTEDEIEQFEYLLGEYGRQKQQYLAQIHSLMEDRHRAFLAGYDTAQHSVEIEQYRQMIRELEDNEAEIFEYAQELSDSRTYGRERNIDQFEYSRDRRDYGDDDSRDYGDGVGKIFGEILGFLAIALGAFTGWWWWASQQPASLPPPNQVEQRQSTQGIGRSPAI